jgi:hypothetical protein
MDRRARIRRNAPWDPRPAYSSTSSSHGYRANPLSPLEEYSWEADDPKSFTNMAAAESCIRKLRIHVRLSRSFLQPDEAAKKERKDLMEHGFAPKEVSLTSSSSTSELQWGTPARRFLTVFTRLDSDPPLGARCTAQWGLPPGSAQARQAEQARQLAFARALCGSFRPAAAP